MINGVKISEMVTQHPPLSKLEGDSGIGHIGVLSSIEEYCEFHTVCGMTFDYASYDCNGHAETFCDVCSMATVSQLRQLAQAHSLDVITVPVVNCLGPACKNATIEYKLTVYWNPRSQRVEKIKFPNPYHCDISDGQPEA
jgi:hypothetical protein